MKTVKSELNDAIKSGKTVLVEFYADWCPHCQHMKPIVDEFRKAEAGKVEVVQVEEHETELMAEYDVQSYPTWVVFSDGSVVYRTTGEKKLSELERMVEAHMVTA